MSHCEYINKKGGERRGVMGIVVFIGCISIFQLFVANNGARESREARVR